ncbi:MAG: zinc-binding dehydrogenase [Desulfobacterales bacterium]
MKAVYFETHGESEVLRYGEVPDPQAGPGEVVVRVRACALNYLDIWVRRGWPGLELSMPHWCGADVAGEVAATGPGVEGWPVGTRVVVDPGISLTEDEFTRRGEDSVSPGYHILGEHRRGGAAEFVAVPARNLHRLPEGVGYAEAAAPLLVGLTAWRMLIHRAALRPAESVLVVGAGGGVNTMAIQIARLAGARVFVVAGSADKAAAARGLGAEEVFDRTQGDWVREVLARTGKRGVDVVVDNVGRATLASSLKAVARGGRVVIVGNTSGPLTEIDLRFLFAKQVSLIGSTMGSHEDFRVVTGLLWAGKLRPVIDRTFPLREGVAAYRRLEEGRHFGKIVLLPG